VSIVAPGMTQSGRRDDPKGHYYGPGIPRAAAIYAKSSEASVKLPETLL
jgi:hypothetical protein